MSDAPTQTQPAAFGRGGVIAPGDVSTGREVPPPPAGSLPGDDALDPVRPSNGLDAIRAELAAEVTPDELPLDVPTRDGYIVRYRCDVNNDELTAWRKKATIKAAKGDKPAQYDEAKVAAIILANKAVAIVARGVELTNEGEPMTFGTPAFWDLVGKASSTEAVRHFYGLDGHVIAAANMVLDASGFGGELLVDDETDPTKTSR